ncbi:winged helix-turn-helix transcriptional regulator [Actinocrispum wychmicini]|uniref:HxlR family transcriptional regulator n=1 Tax=Actinocrispum wychmicini TaxID=1213861 RepID=A0A4R2JIC3_9PSEU|nr:winged helix-turn-helix transcriptional regulator [Actinocrispum wychmicini]TCO59653.1 HxlR family transcriptional regulator [Actinocrispum wychmicini]
MAGKRDYGQFCGLAAGLNIIGERWTLLLVRELLVSPLRFNELLDNLPGVGPNLLTERLKMLAEHDLVEQLAVAGDGRAKLYRLTELGQQLRGPVLGLARWGMQFLSVQDLQADEIRPEWGIIAVQAMVDTDRLPEVDETYEFQVGDERFRVVVQGGAVSFVPGPAGGDDAGGPAAVVVTSDPDTFIQIGAGMLTAFDALAAGQIKIEGPADAIRRCTRMLGLH